MAEAATVSDGEGGEASPGETEHLRLLFPNPDGTFRKAIKAAIIQASIERCNVRWWSPAPLRVAILTDVWGTPAQLDAFRSNEGIREAPTADLPRHAPPVGPRPDRLQFPPREGFGDPCPLG